MFLADIQKILADFTQSSSLNEVPQLSNLRIFDAPIIAVAASSDPLFEKLKQPDVIGAHHLSPREWLPGSRAVISYFLPFTSAVRVSNRQEGWPSQEWLYGRIEGQTFNAALSMTLAGQLQKAGYPSISPAVDSRFAVVDRRSNWSERHVAFIAGLGTLSLNRSLITRIGSAGRIGSVVTELELPATPRYYSEIEENCSHCGVCIGRCPPLAITEAGKDHAICDVYLADILKRFTPRYGCGKCQTAVPCEEGIPVRRNSS